MEQLETRDRNAAPNKDGLEHLVGVLSLVFEHQLFWPAAKESWQKFSKFKYFRFY